MPDDPTESDAFLLAALAFNLGLMAYAMYALLSRSEAPLRNELPGSSASRHAKPSFAKAGSQAELGNQDTKRGFRCQLYQAKWVFSTAGR
jgi:hypothetical protein